MPEAQEAAIKDDNIMVDLDTTGKSVDVELDDSKANTKEVETKDQPIVEVKEKKELEKIILCDVQTEIYPDLEKTFLNLMHNSGYPEIKIEKKIDFEKLYNERLS